MTTTPQPAPARRRGLWIGIVLCALAGAVALRLKLASNDNGGAPVRNSSAAPASSLDRRIERELPRPLGTIDETIRSCTVRVADALGRAVPGADVRVWIRDARHPDSAALDAAKAAFIHRLDSSGRFGDPELSWGVLCWADPTWEPSAYEFKTDESGRVGVTLPRAVVAIAASKPGIGTSSCWTGDTGTDVTFELQPATRVTGRVLDSSGVAVAGATVYCSVSALGFDRKSPLRVRRPTPHRTDAEGRFALDLDAPPAMLSLWALANGDWSSRELFLSGPCEQDDVVLRMFGMFTIQGVVTLPDGRPAAGAEVCADGPGSILRTATAEDGRFRLDVAEPGSWSLAARSEGHLSASAEHVTIDASSPSAELALPLIAAASIAGRVRWDSGEAAPGFLIHTEYLSRNGQELTDWLSHSFAIRRSVVSDATGSFRLEGLSPSTLYTLKATRSEDAAESQSFEDVPSGTTDVELIVRRAGAGLASLAGRVIDDESGEPIMDFDLRIDTSGYFNGLLDDTSAAVHAADGSFKLERLPKQMHWLRIRGEGYPPKMVGPLLPGRDESVEVRLGHLATLGIIVVDETGAPAPGALVRLRECESAASPMGPFQPPSEQRALSDGRATWTDLPPATYVLQASGDDADSGVEVVALRAGSPREVTLQMDRSRLGRLQVKAHHPDGSPYPGVEFQALTFGQDGDSRLLPFIAVTDARGEALLGPMAPGSYIIMPTSASGFAPLTTTVTAGVTVTVEVTSSN